MPRKVYLICSLDDDRTMTFRISIQDVDQALLTASGLPSEMVPEGLYKSKLRNSVQLETTLAMYEQQIIRINEQPHYSKLKFAVSC